MLLNVVANMESLPRSSETELISERTRSQHRRSVETNEQTAARLSAQCDYVRRQRRIWDYHSQLSRSCNNNNGNYYQANTKRRITDVTQCNYQFRWTKVTLWQMSQVSCVLICLFCQLVCVMLNVMPSTSHTTAKKLTYILLEFTFDCVVPVYIEKNKNNGLCNCE